MRVGILGGGRWGQALARLVVAAGHEPLIGYRDRRPPHVLPSTDNPPEVSATCELLLVATSADKVRQAIQLAQPGPTNSVIVAGRGMDPTTGRWLPDAVREEADVAHVGALAGPAPVDEILNGHLCAGVVASTSTVVSDQVVEALHSSRYRCYRSDDLVGVCMTGAMMPVLATLLGVAMNLRGAGVGIHAMVLARGLAETARLGQAIGADPTTAMGLAGVADLVAAQARPGHPHYDVGRAIAEGRLPDHAPAVSLARAMHTLAASHQLDTPLLAALVAMLDGEPPIDAVQRLMKRDPKREVA